MFVMYVPTLNLGSTEPKSCAVLSAGSGVSYRGESRPDAYRRSPPCRVPTPPGAQSAKVLRGPRVQQTVPARFAGGGAWEYRQAGVDRAEDAVHRRAARP